MLEPLPKLDPRHASDIHKELQAIASVLLPEWRGGEFEGDFGQALLKILSRLGGHVNTRIDKTPWRDAIAFYNLLEVPVQTAYPSSVPLVFLLGEKHESQVFMPAGIQVGASTDDGEILFETSVALNLTPARLECLVAVDGKSDRIESAPPGFLELSPQKSPLPLFRIVNSLGKGSRSIQIEPFEGLDKGDYIQIASSTHRISEVHDGLLTLLDPLENDIESGSSVEKVENFNTFNHRDIQQHALYLGHSELFNLKQKASITLNLEPTINIGEFSSNGVQWSLYGTKENEDEAIWQAIRAQSGLEGQLILESDVPIETEDLEVNGIKSRWLRAEFTAENSNIERISEINIGVKSLIEDQSIKKDALSENKTVTTTITQAFHNNLSISLESEFLPFGPEPLRFDTFSIAAPEAFTKKGARVTLSVTIKREFDDYNPLLAWEYFDGDGWRSLELKADTTEGTDNFQASGTGEIIFTVPDDLTIGEVAGQEDYWIRARLSGGEYGRPKYPFDIEETPLGVGGAMAAVGPGNSPALIIDVDTSTIHPPFISKIEATFDATKPYSAEHVLVESNLDFYDYTQASVEDNASFVIFEGAANLNNYINPQRDISDASKRVIYLGFNKPFGTQPLSLYIDAEDHDSKVHIKCEVLASDDWHAVNAVDTTNGFYRRGFIQVVIDSKPRIARLFGKELYWLRIRPRGSNDIDWQPILRGVYLNAVYSQQAETVEQEVLGSSLGEPGFQVGLSNQPILCDSLEIRVSENLSDEEREGLQNNTQNLPAHEQPIRVFQELSLEGDWVLWQRVDGFSGAGPDDRVYRLDHASGEIKFGDNIQGRIPPAGNNNIRAIKYQTGGGIKGNVDAYTITALKSGVEGVESVANPIQAAGGTDAPAIEEQVALAPSRLRRVGQSISAPDFESLLVSSSPDLIRARCVLPKLPDDPIRIAVVIKNGDRCPMPTLAESDALSRLVRSQSWGGLRQSDIKVTGPDYVAVRIVLRLRAKSNERIAELEHAATDQIRLLLHPVLGGPSGTGWPFGRRLWESDMLRALYELPAFDSVLALTIKPEFTNELSSLGMICAQINDIEIFVEPGEEG